MKTHADMEKVLFSKEEISEKVAEVAKRLSVDYEGKNPLLICVLKGASVFFVDLIREISIDIEMEFMSVSSYGNSTQSSGRVKIEKDVGIDLTGRNVIIVEDIVDTGNTLFNLRKLLSARGASDVKICCLLDKPSRRTADIKPDYVCFEIPDEFVIGYGLDYAEKYRNLDCVGVIKSSAVMGSSSK